jgi:hypothetical protein
MTLKIGGALSALNRQRTEELRVRQLADTILAPEAISGKTSAARLLHTTLGGVRRHITNADLAAFKKSAKALGTKMREGITAQEIIDLSASADRDRARKEIKSSIATRLHQGSVLFTTPSGPDSKVHRHFVSLVFPGYGAAIAFPGTALQAAAELAKAPLKFDCDCEHHRYRHRFIATAMGINAARPENGFPKLTNPTLIGVACKHVIRTLIELQGSMIVRKMVAKMIQADRDRLTPGGRTKVITTTREEADKALQGRTRTVRTTNEKYAASIRKALPKGLVGTPTAAEINKTMVELQSRTDIPSMAILQALQTVLQQHPR